MLFVRHDLGRYAALSTAGAHAGAVPAPTAVHWWAGTRKPWQRPPLGSGSITDLGELGCVYEYLTRTRGIDAGAAATPCIQRLRAWRRELEADPRYAAATAPQSFVHRCPGFASFPLF